VPARALVRAVRAWPGVIDVVVARDDVAAYFAGEPRVDRAWLAALATLADVVDAPRDHVLRARYDGPDLDELAGALAISAAELARRHAAATYTVDTIGFLPGFAYLVGLDAALAAVPRRATPRPRVPAGSIGIAGGFTGVYPFESPGGWQLIGRVVDVELFGERGALLAHGDRVRFQP
jgi:5-oxoprolinase (ATP-hydrolysing) subunit A